MQHEDGDITTTSRQAASSSTRPVSLTQLRQQFAQSRKLSSETLSSASSASISPSSSDHSGIGRPPITTSDSLLSPYTPLYSYSAAASATAAAMDADATSTLAHAAGILPTKPATYEHDPQSTPFSRLVLSLLDTLERDPQGVLATLKTEEKRRHDDPIGYSEKFAAYPPETDAILASLARIADNAARRETPISPTREMRKNDDRRPPTGQSLSSSVISSPNLSNTTPSSADNSANAITVPPSLQTYSSGGSVVSVSSGVAPSESTATTASRASDYGDATNEGQLSAEQELKLLKAQVQDFARVCKVHSTGLLTAYASLT